MGDPRRLPGRPRRLPRHPAATGVRWSGCRDGSEVVHYRINGGDHQAPRTITGRPFAQVVWDFFAAHPLPG
jgi:polyhydroxybutyrate depolymerase